MYYRASRFPNIAVLEPKVSNHGIPLVYLSKKRENTLVYLSNAVERYCREAGFSYCGVWRKWGSYGFAEDGILRIEEYYPNATELTYKGVCGYIYRVKECSEFEAQPDIPDAFISRNRVAVDSCEYIEDAYREIMTAVNDGKIRLQRFEDNSARKMSWISKTMKSEYDSADNHPEYRFFIKNHFDITE